MEFLVYGDMGADDRIPTYGHLEKHVAMNEYAAILHVGDFAYDMHSDNGKVGIHVHMYLTSIITMPFIFIALTSTCFKTLPKGSDTYNLSLII